MMFGLILVVVLATNTVLKTPVVDSSRTWLVNKYVALVGVLEGWLVHNTVLRSR